jgi:formylglycine-generating enzyme required for sulfatase activity
LSRLSSMLLLVNVKKSKYIRPLINKQRHDLKRACYMVNKPILIPAFLLLFVCFLTGCGINVVATKGGLIAEGHLLLDDNFTNSIGMKFKLIPAGRFLMGSPVDEKTATRTRVFICSK